MGLKLKKEEAFNEGWHRVVMEETYNALNEIHNSKENPHIAVHEIRKSYKKVRAALRLIRKEFPSYTKANKLFRDQGRKISEIRDLTSHLEVMELITNEYNDQLYKNTFSGIIEQIKGHRKDLTESHLFGEKVLEDMRSELLEYLEEMKSWKIPGNNFETINKSLKKVYQRGADMYQISKKSKSSEDFHEWRKRVKYLKYELHMMKRIWPRVMKSMEKELDELSDLLGADHDLVELTDFLNKGKIAFKDKDEKTLLFSIIHEQREQLQKHALRLGRRFYKEDPDEFTDRIGAYWKAHQQEIEEMTLTDKKLLVY